MPNKELFITDYLFRGEHAIQVKALTSQVDNSGARIFASAIELFMIAALLGCEKDLKSEPKKSDEIFRIMAGQFNNHYDDLMFIYKLILVASEDGNLGSLDRKNRAFRESSDEDNYKLLERYMLGGIEMLYDLFLNSASNRYQNYLTTASELLEANKLKKNEEDGPDIFEGEVFSS